MRYFLALILCIIFATTASAGPVVPLAFLGFDFDIADAVGDFGQDIVDALWKFVEDLMIWLEELAVTHFGLDVDVDAIEDEFEFAKGLSSSINEVIPIWGGMAIVFGGVVVQWVLLIVRYVLGYFTGG